MTVSDSRAELLPALETLLRAIGPPPAPPPNSRPRCTAWTA